MQIPVVRGRRARATCLAVVLAAVVAGGLAGEFSVARTARSVSATAASVLERGLPDVTTTRRSTASNWTVRPAAAVAEAAQTSEVANAPVEVPDLNDVAKVPVAVDLPDVNDVHEVPVAVEVPDVNDVNDVNEVPVGVAASAVVEAPAAVEAPEISPVTDEVTEAVADVAADVEAAPTASNQSTCRSDLAGAVMTIAMPDISYWCPVYAGGQSVIDSGVATVITAQGWGDDLASHPGNPGTLWITGHRSSHGGAFAAVPDLRDGAIVTVSDENRTASYVIVGRSYVEVRDGLAVDASGRATEAATLDAVLRPDRNSHIAARLLLQTCEGEDFRWMIYADLIDN